MYTHAYKCFDYINMIDYLKNTYAYAKYGIFSVELMITFTTQTLEK